MTPLMRILRERLSRREEHWDIIGNGDQIFLPARNDVKFIDCTDVFPELILMANDFGEPKSPSHHPDRDEWRALDEVSSNVLSSYHAVWLEHMVPARIEDGVVQGYQNIRRAVILSGMTPDANGIFQQSGFAIIDYDINTDRLFAPTHDEYMSNNTRTVVQHNILSYRLMIYHLHRSGMVTQVKELSPKLVKLQRHRKGRTRNDFIRKHHVARLIVDGVAINPAQVRREHQGILPYHQVAAHDHTYHYSDGPKKVWVDTYWRGNKERGLITKTYKAEMAKDEHQNP